MFHFLLINAQVYIFLFSNLRCQSVKFELLDATEADKLLSFSHSSISSILFIYFCMGVVSFALYMIFLSFFFFFLFFFSLQLPSSLQAGLLDAVAVTLFLPLLKTSRPNARRGLQPWGDVYCCAESHKRTVWHHVETEV